ncbi:MAG: hypothetical protein JWR68_2796 [Polaromonas sp.]|nr:hypothetical protein [Polaromonas sp.]
MPEASNDSPDMKQNSSPFASQGPFHAENDDPCASPRGLRPGCMNSTEILRGHKAVEIHHNGLTYRLQTTRLGKLILTK